MDAIRMDEPAAVDSWALRGGRYCADCGRTLFTGNTSPLCPSCLRPRRTRCLAGDCDRPPHRSAYCALHLDRVRRGAPVDAELYEITGEELRRLSGGLRFGGALSFGGARGRAAR